MKMLHLKGDLICNDNSWMKLMKSAGLGLENNDEMVEHITDDATKFIDTFNNVCRKHRVKKDQTSSSRPEFPHHIKDLLAKVKRYSIKCHGKGAGAGHIPEEINVVHLAHAKQNLK